MTTLQGQDLFNYLNNLTQEITKLRSSTQEGSLVYNSHTTLIDILNSEQNFIKQTYPEGNQMLFFSLNGFPSLNSLIPDLKSISNNPEQYPEISQNFDQNYFIDNNEIITFELMKKNKIVSEITKKEYDSRIEKLSGIKTKIRRSFGLRENNNRLELALREYIHLDNPDIFSLQYPLLSQERLNQYHMALGSLFSDGEDKFYYLDPKKIDFKKINHENKKDLASLIIPTKTSLYLDRLKVPASAAYKIVRNIATGIYNTGLYFLAAPTTILIDKNNPKGLLKNLDGIERPLLTIPSIFLSIRLGINAINEYSDTGMTQKALLLTTPVITNIASLFYEWYRYEKNKILENNQKQIESNQQIKNNQPKLLKNNQ